MLVKGTTFIRKGHVWFNLSEPSCTSPYVLCVNLTCLDDDCPDDECPLRHADYAWIKKDYPTTVAFTRPYIWNADKIEACLKNGELQKPHEGDIPAATLSKIIKIAKTSRELSDEKKAFLA